MDNIKIGSLVKIKPNRMDDYKIYLSIGLIDKIGLIKSINPTCGEGTICTVKVEKKEYSIPTTYLELVKE